ncbi:MAG: PGF-pre-PGF domain-containing protein, partial [Candidatus Hadarchaeales archaeon]
MDRAGIEIWLKWVFHITFGCSDSHNPSYANFSSPTGSGAPNIAGGAAPSPTQADFSTPRSGPDDVGGAAPPTFVPLWQKVASVLLCIFLLFSPFPALPVAAAEISAGERAFENTENVGGVIRLVYGYTSGTFTSEPIYVGENWEGLALWWREEEPSLLQEISRAGLLPSTSPAAGNARSLGPVADAWTNITISGYLESAGNVNGSSESTSGGFDPHAESWTNIMISGFWLSENGVGAGEAENSLPRFAALDENSPTLEQGTDNLNLPENSEVPENAVENLQGGAPADNTIQQENAAPSAKENILLTSSVRVQVRVSENGEGWSDWMGPDGTSSTYFDKPPVKLSKLPPGRYLQYRVHFHSDGPRLSGGNGPWIGQIEIKRSSRGFWIGRIARGKWGEASFTGMPLRRVRISPRVDVADAEVFAEVLERLPAGVPPIDGKRVYAYMEISTTVSNSSIERAEIEFEIPKGWMRADSSILAYHYGERGWEELPTFKILEDATTARFLAFTSGFSTYAFVDDTYSEFKENGGGTTMFENVDVVWLDYDNGNRPYSGGYIRLTTKAGREAAGWGVRENIDDVGGYAGKAMVGAENILSGKRYIFVLWRDGPTTDKFRRYDVSTGTWEVLRSPSDNGLAYVRNGVAMTWDNGNYIYALVGETYQSNTTDDENRWFYRYNIAENYWEVLENTPIGQGPGGAIVWVKRGDNQQIYAWIGTTSTSDDGAQRGVSEFWRYDISMNKWVENLKRICGYTTTYKTAESRGLNENSGYGSDDGSYLVWAGEENYIYYLVGAYNEGLNTSDEGHFLRYHIPTNTFENLPKFPDNGDEAGGHGVDDGGTLAWDGGNFIYAAKGGDGNGTPPSDNFYRFNIRENKWENMPLLPEPIGGGYGGARLASMNGKIYFWRGYLTTGFWCLENLRYYAQGAFTSHVFDARTVVSWDNISWDGVTPDQTAIKFQVSTSADGTAWTSFVGPDNTPSSYFTVSGESMENIAHSRYIKYRAYLSTENENVSPVLKWVKISYTTPWNIDNFNEDFAQGTHENTENVNDAVELAGENIQGQFTSRIFDSGDNNTIWESISWRALTPSSTTGENDNVGAEPGTLVDGNSRRGIIISGSYSSTAAQDGSYEIIAENTLVPPWTQTDWSGGRTGAPAEAGQWSSSYSKFYENDNTTGLDGENIKLLSVGGPSGSWTQTRWSGMATKENTTLNMGPVLEVGSWTSSYDNFYWSENIDPSNLPGENLMLRGSPSAWENLGMPIGGTDGASATYGENGNKRYIFYLRSGTGGPFWRYDIVANRWEPLASAPVTTRAGASVAYAKVGENSYVYMIDGGGSTSLYRYKVAENLWENTGATIPVGAATGSQIIWNRDNALFLICGTTTVGNNFYVYSLADNVWYRLADIGVAPAAGSSISWFENKDDNYIFAAIGGTKAFRKYSVKENRWYPIESIVTWRAGAAQVRVDNVIYLVDGGNSPTFYRWFINENIWENLSGTAGFSLPIPNYTSQRLVFDENNFLFFVRGGVLGDRTFWRSKLINAPYSSGGYLDSSIYDAGGSVNWTTVVWNGTTPTGTSIAVYLRSGNDDNPYDGGWSDWIPHENEVENPSLPDSRYIQYRIVFSTTDNNVTPALFDITINYSGTGGYCENGYLISSVFDSGSNDTLWDNISWDNFTPAGTNIELWVRFDNTLDANNLPTTSWENVPSNPWTSFGKVARYVQYMVVENTSDASVTPVVKEVRIKPAVRYGLRWQHTIENIDSTAQWENLKLRIYGYSDPDENVGVYVWDNSSSQWLFIDNLPSGTPGLIENRIYTSYLDAGKLYIKYESADNTDSTQTTIYIDQCVVVQENINETSVTMEVRFDNDATGILSKPWTLVSNGQSLGNVARYAQYRAKLSTEDSTITPILDWVMFSYTPPPPSWCLAESWSAAIETSIQWQLAESWATTISAASQWRLAEGWNATVTTFGEWRLVESWSSAVITSSEWSQVESWSGMMTTAGVWQLVESWNATIMTSAEWRVAEMWQATITTMATWQQAESWSATINTTAGWQLAEMRQATITTSAQWKLAESWSATMTGGNWNLVETWSAIIYAPPPKAWVQTRWSGVPTKEKTTLTRGPVLEVGQWDNSYENFYWSENIDASDGENVKLRGSPTAWSAMANTLGYGAGVCAAYAENGGVRYIYSLRGGGTTDFYRYRIDTNTWENLSASGAPAPAPVGTGASLVYAENGGIKYLYALQGNSSTGFWRYRIDTNTWETMAPTPAAVDSGGALGWTGGDNIYATQGGTRDFWRYYISTDTWDNTGLVALGAATAAGTTMIHFENSTDNYLFITNIGTTYRLQRFAVGTNALANMASPPGTLGAGCSLARVDNVIYVARGAGYTDFFRYFINTNTWENISSTAAFPATVGTNSGQRLVFDENNFLYMIRGVTTTAFWKSAINNIPYCSGGYIESSIFDAGETVDWKTVVWNGSTPAGTSIAVYLRSGNDENPYDGGWSEWVQHDNFTSNPSLPDSRYLQYRVVFSTTDNSITPVLFDITVYYVAIPAWRVVESWSAAIETSIQWQLAESWTGTIITATGWQLVETWQATITTSAQWKLVETWAGTITTSASWQQVESWTATIATAAVWQVVESWTGAISTTAGWQVVETWQVMITTTAQWKLVESWTATVTTSAAWQLAETWQTTVATTAAWQLAESWISIITATAAWSMVESWTATLRTYNEWEIVETWSGTVTAAASWTQTEVWQATVATAGAWQAAEIWTGTISTLAQWQVVETWASTVTTAAQWQLAETWQATITTSAQWKLVETWQATINTTAGWQLAEMWQAMITTSAGWQLVESWTATITTTAVWQLVESWTAAIITTAGWQLVETWAATISTTAQWKLVESWSATINTTAGWQLAETWQATITTSTQWKLVETWQATITTSTQWKLAESWTATITTTAQWQLVETWTGTISTTAVWQIADVWSAAIGAPAEWAVLEAWAATMKTFKEWELAETWESTITAAAAWNGVEGWTAAVQTSAGWQLAESWTGTMSTTAAWQIAETWTATITTFNEWRLVESW